MTVHRFTETTYNVYVAGAVRWLMQRALGLIGLVWMMIMTLATCGCASEQGQRVTIEGIAADTKAGAVVLVDGKLFYVADLHAWSPDLIGTRVRVEGVLRYINLSSSIDDGLVRQEPEPDEIVRLENARVIDQKP